jgi:hypothetical protein
VNIAQNVAPNELCIVLQQHLVNIAQNVGPNELCIVPQQHLVNTPQNVGMNDWTSLCGNLPFLSALVSCTGREVKFYDLILELITHI